LTVVFFRCFGGITELVISVFTILLGTYHRSRFLAFSVHIFSGTYRRISDNNDKHNDKTHQSQMFKSSVFHKIPPYAKAEHHSAFYVQIILPLKNLQLTKS
jgi:hypothetical protein